MVSRCCLPLADYGENQFGVWLCVSMAETRIRDSFSERFAWCSVLELTMTRRSTTTTTMLRRHSHDERILVYSIRANRNMSVTLMGMIIEAVAIQPQKWFDTTDIAGGNDIANRFRLRMNRENGGKIATLLDFHQKRAGCCFKCCTRGNLVWFNKSSRFDGFRKYSQHSSAVILERRRKTRSSCSSHSI